MVWCRFWSWTVHGGSACRRSKWRTWLTLPALLSSTSRTRNTSSFIRSALQPSRFTLFKSVAPAAMRPCYITCTVHQISHMQQVMLHTPLPLPSQHPPVTISLSPFPVPTELLLSCSKHVLHTWKSTLLVPVSLAAGRHLD